MARRLAQVRADRVFHTALDRWLETLTEGERASRLVHERLARRVRDSLEGADSASVARIIARDFRAFERDRLRIIERVVTQGATAGSGLTEQTARAVFGNANARRALAPSLTDASTLARRIASGRLNGEATADGVAARTRLRARTAATARRMTEQVRESIRLGETTQETAQRMLRSTDIEVRIPRYIQRVRDAVASAPPSEVRRVVRAQLSALQDGRIQEHNIAQETRRFLRTVDRSKGADIDRAVDQWVRGRAANQAMTIARTEGQAALADTYVASTSDQPWVKGYRWNISPAHDKPDVCDVMAAQDNFGLGGGGYPVDAVPSLAHPNDLCYFTAIIDEHHLERELAERRGDPEPPRTWETSGGMNGRQWLASQPPERREAILGPGRAREFARRPGRVVNDDGSLNPLWRVQGRPQPEPPDGERRIVRRQRGESSGS